MSEPSRARVLDTFVREFSQRNRIDAESIARHHMLVQAFLDSRPDRELAQFDSSDIEHFASARAALGENADRVGEARMAARAFVQFLRSGGISRVPAEVVAQEQVFDDASLALMREDVRRMWSIDGLAYALAVTVPLFLVLLGSIFAVIGYAIHYAGLAGTYFMLLAHVAQGRADLPQSATEDLLRNLWRGFMVIFVAVVPALAVNIYLDIFGATGLSLWAPTFVAGLVGAALLPAASIAVYTSNSGLAAAAPHVWYAIITGIPKAYASVAAVYVVLLAVLMLWRALVGVALGWMPGLAMLVYSPIACGIVFALATVLGGVIHRNRLR